MTMICFASQKGSPGVTLAALTVAASWPADESRHKLLLEADPSGGTLALRYGLGLQTSLVTLAVAARAGLDDATLADHTQELPGGLPAILAPDGPSQVAAALEASGSSIASWLVDHPTLDTVVDLGRLTDASLPFVSAADVLLMVARPDVEHLQPTARRMADLAGAVLSVGWVLIGDGPHAAEEVAETYGYPVVAVLPHDPRSAAAITTGAGSRRLTRSPLIRAASSTAHQLHAFLHPELAAASATGEPEHETAQSPPDRPEPALITGEAQ
ncbi:MAG: hypothetical protein GY704_10050 [Phycisphaeraceae bacterium]|nr:hypothetical protein [Phycisphaeraceae bacterium]